MNKPLTFLLMGRSGSGKGTQSALLQEFLKKEFPREIRSLEGGAEFRKYIAEEGYSQGISKKIYEEGGLQPAFISIYLWSGLLIKHVTGEEHLVIDGAARRLVEAEALDSALDFYSKDKRIVIHIKVSREWSTARLLARARADDNERDIGRRLDWFDKEVLPAMNFFRNNPAYNFIEVDGEQPIEKVHADILASVKEAVSYGSR